jgi:hypothetical protein
VEREVRVNGNVPPGMKRWILWLIGSGKLRKGMGVRLLLLFLVAVIRL